jgi:hypothetical protein
VANVVAAALGRENSAEVPEANRAVKFEDVYIDGVAWGKVAPIYVVDLIFRV